MRPISMKKLIRILSVLLAVILLFSVTACGKTIGTNNPEQEASIEQESAKTAEKQTDKETTANNTETTKAADNNTTPQNSGENAITGGIDGGTNTGSASSGTSSEGNSQQAAVTPTPSPTEAPTEPPTEAPTQPPAPTWTIYVTVDACQYGGVIGGGTFTYYYQPTVYDALVSTGLGYTGSSDYIRSINGLGEFDHGRMSGWLYAVNGVEPGVGCGSYYLNDGDSVYWHYQGDE